MLLRKLTLIAGIACSVLLNASFLSGQESKPPPNEQYNRPCSSSQASGSQERRLRQRDLK